MRRYIGTFVVLLMFSLASPPASAASSATLTLVGANTAWTDLELTRQVLVDAGRASISTRGTHAGFYFEPLNASGTPLGRVSLRDFHGPGELGYVGGMSSSDGTLPAGHYRVYLIASGPTTVRIPLTGMASRTVTPRHRVRASDVVQVLTTNQLSVSGRESLVAARRSYSLSGLLLEQTQAFAGTLGVCLTAPGGNCDSGGPDSGRAGWFINPYGAYGFEWVVSYAPGAKQGRMDAVQTATNVVGIKGAVGASFTLELA